LGWTEATLREQIEAAVRTASALLAENYRAQDRKRLIRCTELLDDAMRSIEGGVWRAEERSEPREVAEPPREQQEPARGRLIVREMEQELVRKAG
jgi:hypothetical protein